MDDFEQRWLAFVRRFADAPTEQRGALVADALEHGLPPATGEPLLATDLPVADRVRAEMAVVAASGEFDSFGYWWHNQDRAWTLCGYPEELRHFVTQGWKELRHPSPSFDLWFYWNAHLDPTSEAVNPFLHYVAGGPPGRVGDPARGARPRARPGTRGSAAPGVPVRRPTTSTASSTRPSSPTWRDLSRFADVYYLADCEMEQSELDKVAPYTRGRWAIRHGRYDFGSYSMLARDLVGWDTIEQYDELLLANDSCYLVQPFDQVFARMEAQACDWWGMQATYEDFTTSDFERLGRPLAIDDVEEQMRQIDLWRYNDFIHVGSYFVGYRRRVIDDPAFRARLDGVTAQTDKTTIILKYEIGFSRLLILGGYHLATFVEGILPYHPVYRESAFELMREGFPLLKRQFLYENPFSRPDLRQWKERVLAIAPGADVEAMERNLHRVAPAWSLHRSFAIRSRPDGTIELPAAPGPDTFDDEDRWTPTHPHWWVFPVDPRTGVLPGEVRGLLEAIRDDPSVHAIVLSAHRPVKVGGARVVTVPGESAPGQMYALRAGTIVVTAGPRSDVNHPLSARHHRFLKVGSPAGLEPPRMVLTGLWGEHDPPPEAYERSLVTQAVVSSPSLVEGVVATHGRVAPDDVWATGSPRVDLLLADEADLSAALRADLAALRDGGGGTARRGRLSAGRDHRGRRRPGAPGPRTTTTSRSCGPPRPAGPRRCRRRWSTCTTRPCCGPTRSPRTRSSPRWPGGSPTWSPPAGAPTSPTRPCSPCPLVALPGASGSPLVEHPTLADGLVAVEAFLDGTPVDEAWLAWGRSLHSASDGHSGDRLVHRIKATYLPYAEWEQDVSAG